MGDVLLQDYNNNVNPIGLSNELREIEAVSQDYVDDGRQFQMKIEALFELLKDYGKRYEWDEAKTVLEELLNILNTNGEKIELLKKKIGLAFKYIEDRQHVPV